VRTPRAHVGERRVAEAFSGEIPQDKELALGSKRVTAAGSRRWTHMYPASLNTTPQGFWGAFLEGHIFWHLVGI
jgi:hypothetical protein